MRQQSLGQTAPAIAGWIGIRLGLLWDWLLIRGACRVVQVGAEYCGTVVIIRTGMGRTKERDDGLDDGIVPEDMAVLKKLG